ncbi:predicted protein [Pediculus humanus corporis]|uniref:Odorant receptor n=1 Tax=Pediculus humanus subsp. corporis TaxID=121224 RepID=E0W326_PEDHC|nr:uncharacterized protein Phum_PHUM600520 [Pediculus humanus corporis]EEB20032.1 predicted protein [Pediculus humanus corporis]
MVSDSMEKITWNLCISSLFSGSIVKNINLYTHYSTLRYLRLNLHNDSISRNEDDKIYDEKASRRYRAFRTFLYIMVVVFMPIWVVCKYNNVEKVLPIPLRLPINFSSSTMLSYDYEFAIIAICATLGLIFVIELEMAIYSVGVAVYSTNWYLMDIDIQKDIQMVILRSQNPAVFTAGKVIELNVNAFVNKMSSSEMETSIYSSQFKLFQLWGAWPVEIIFLLINLRYTQHFEKIYSGLLFFQLFIGGFLVVINAVQTMTSNKIMLSTLKCNRKVGEGMYDLPWYSLSIELRKDILFIILKSQKPPRISAGKIIELNMETFSEATKNMYRWLAVFRQVGFR